MDAGTLTVGQLASGIDAALSSWFAGELWVVGEIDSLRRSNSGHVYFQLVERSDEHSRAAASIDVALFDAARRYVNTQLRGRGRRAHDRWHAGAHPWSPRVLRTARSRTASDVGHRSRVHARAAAHRA